MNNIFITFLNLLRVKHTKTFACQYFNEHPYKYSLFGLSKMLSDYDVDNVATRIPDKENNLTEIATPFIAQFGGDFVAVQKVDSGQVSFRWKGAMHVLPVARFSEAWNGIALLAESSEKSVEPDYREHRQTELLKLVKQTAFLAACGLIFVIAYINNLLYTNAGVSLLLIINLTGMYTIVGNKLHNNFFFFCKKPLSLRTKK